MSLEDLLLACPLHSHLYWLLLPGAQGLLRELSQGWDAGPAGSLAPSI